MSAGLEKLKADIELLVNGDWEHVRILLTFLAEKIEELEIREQEWLEIVNKSMALHGKLVRTQK